MQPTSHLIITSQSQVQVQALRLLKRSKTNFKHPRHFQGNSYYCSKLLSLIEGQVEEITIKEEDCHVHNLGHQNTIRT